MYPGCRMVFLPSPRSLLGRMDWVGELCDEPGGTSGLRPCSGLHGSPADRGHPSRVSERQGLP